MVMPLVISSSSNNQKQLGFTVSSSNNYRNRSLSLFPSFINGGGEPNYSNQQELGFAIATNTHRNKCLSLVPSFNGGDDHHQVMNGVSFNHSNLTNRSLSLVPSFNGGDRQVINEVSLNYPNNIYRSVSLVPSVNDHERVIGFSVSSSSNHRNRSLSLVPRFNDYEPVMNTGISSNYSNQQKLGFSVSSSSHVNRSLSLIPRFSDYEPVINNGISSNYSNPLELGFPVSSSNHRNRSLSLVPSFKIRGEPVNMIARTRSFMRNHHFSYSSRPAASREILRARLISALATRCQRLTNQEEAIYTRSGSRFSSQIHSQLNFNNSQQHRSRLTITELHEEGCSDDNKANSNYNEALAPTPVSVYYPSKTNNENESDNEDDAEKGDGITHSLPCKKYGPYTCPRCFGKFPTSQTFAAHVSSHYKYETKAQRRRRLMAKIRRRKLHLHHSREGITLIPTKASAQREQGPMNMAEAEANGNGVLSKVQIKEEPADF